MYCIYSVLCYVSVCFYLLSLLGSLFPFRCFQVVFLLYISSTCSLLCPLVNRFVVVFSLRCFLYSIYSYSPFGCLYHIGRYSFHYASIFPDQFFQRHPLSLSSSFYSVLLLWLSLHFSPAFLIYSSTALSVHKFPLGHSMSPTLLRWSLSVRTSTCFVFFSVSLVYLRVELFHLLLSHVVPCFGMFLCGAVLAAPCVA